MMPYGSDASVDAPHAPLAIEGPRQYSAPSPPTIADVRAASLRYTRALEAMEARHLALGRFDDRTRADFERLRNGKEFFEDDVEIAWARPLPRPPLVKRIENRCKALARRVRDLVPRGRRHRDAGPAAEQERPPEATPGSPKQDDPDKILARRNRLLMMVSQSGMFVASSSLLAGTHYSELEEHTRELEQRLHLLPDPEVIASGNRLAHQIQSTSGNIADLLGLDHSALVQLTGGSFPTVTLAWRVLHASRVIPHLRHRALIKQWSRNQDRFMRALDDAHRVEEPKRSEEDRQHLKDDFNRSVQVADRMRSELAQTLLLSPDREGLLLAGLRATSAVDNPLPEYESALLLDAPSVRHHEAALLVTRGLPIYRPPTLADVASRMEALNSARELPFER